MNLNIHYTPKLAKRRTISQNLFVGIQISCICMMHIAHSAHAQSRTANIISPKLQTLHDSDIYWIFRQDFGLLKKIQAALACNA